MVDNIKYVCVVVSTYLFDERIGTTRGGAPGTLVGGYGTYLWRNAARDCTNGATVAQCARNGLPRFLRSKRACLVSRST